MAILAFLVGSTMIAPAYADNHIVEQPAAEPDEPIVHETVAVGPPVVDITTGGNNPSTFYGDGNLSITPVSGFEEGLTAQYTATFEGYGVFINSTSPTITIAVDAQGMLEIGDGAYVCAVSGESFITITGPGGTSWTVPAFATSEPGTWTFLPEQCPPDQPLPNPNGEEPVDPNPGIDPTYTSGSVTADGTAILTPQGEFNQSDEVWVVMTQDGVVTDSKGPFTIDGTTPMQTSLVVPTCGSDAHWYWTTTGPAGSVPTSGVLFDGTIALEPCVEEPVLIEAVVEEPTVTIITEPGTRGSVVPATTEGVTYTVSPEGATEGTVTVSATANEGYVLVGYNGPWAYDLGTFVSVPADTIDSATVQICHAVADGDYEIGIETLTARQYESSEHVNHANDIVRGTEYILNGETHVIENRNLDDEGEVQLNNNCAVTNVDPTVPPVDTEEPGDTDGDDDNDDDNSDGDNHGNDGDTDGDHDDDDNDDKDDNDGHHNDDDDRDNDGDDDNTNDGSHGDDGNDGKTDDDDDRDDKDGHHNNDSGHDNDGHHNDDADNDDDTNNGSHGDHDGNDNNDGKTDEKDDRSDKPKDKSDHKSNHPKGHSGKDNAGDDSSKHSDRSHDSKDKTDHKSGHSKDHKKVTDADKSKDNEEDAVAVKDSDDDDSAKRSVQTMVLPDDSKKSDTKADDTAVVSVPDDNSPATPQRQASELAQTGAPQGMVSPWLAILLGALMIGGVFALVIANRMKTAGQVVAEGDSSSAEHLNEGDDSSFEGYTSFEKGSALDEGIGWERPPSE
ncbi:MAG TPA: hypothetical protein VFM68_04150 [Candidatus Saccharimonadales bacterium]|nr:hypothetical protein [Candidatus Saccharimonadales bacterium]